MVNSLLRLRSAVKPKEKLVERAGGKLYLDIKKATGTGLPTNSPLTSPWVNLVNPKTYYNLTNALGNNGNFVTESSGLGTGWTKTGTVTVSMAGNIQTLAPASQYHGITYNLSYTVGDIFYACGYVKSDKTVVRFQIGDPDAVPSGTAEGTLVNTFEFLSGRVTTAAGQSGHAVFVYNGNAANPPTIQVKQVHAFNLTQIFGAGNEPQKIYMDALMKNLIDNEGYIATKSIPNDFYYIKNLMGDYGNFGTTWPVGDALGISSSIANNQMTVVALTTGGSTEHYKGYIYSSPVAAHVYYARFKVNSVTTGKVFASLINRKADSSYEQTSSTKTSSAGYCSCTLTTTTLYSSPTMIVRVALSNSSDAAVFTGSTEQATVSEAMLFDLSAIFGVGNEPTQLHVDSLMAQLVEKNGSNYINTLSTRLYNNPCPKLFDSIITSGVDPTNIKPSWVFAGVEDFMSMVNMPSIDITRPPIAVFATIYVDSTITQPCYIFCKNFDSSANNQYALLWDNTAKKTYASIDGTGYNNTGASASNSAPVDTWVNVGFIWDGVNLKSYINGAQSGTTQALASVVLTSRSFVNIGRRQSQGYFKGKIANLTVYSGAQCTEAFILRAQREISKGYTH